VIAPDKGSQPSMYRTQICNSLASDNREEMIAKVRLESTELNLVRGDDNLRLGHE